MNKISFNIRYLRELKKLSQEALADDLKITRARLGAYEEARNEPPIEMLILLSDYFHVSIDALVRADLRKINPDAMLPAGDNRRLFPIMIDSNNNDKIEVITAKASAGYLSGYADPEYIEELPVMDLPFRVNGKQRAFPVKGDSMPPLANGDFVIGKYIESLNDVNEGKTYILLTKEDGIVYKRVFRKADGFFELRSDNPAYNPYTVSASDVLEGWEYTCSIRVSDKKEEEPDFEGMMKLLVDMKEELERINKK